MTREHLRIFGRNRVYRGADLLWDPTDPLVGGPFGCLIEEADATPGGRALVAKPWETPEILRGLGDDDLPECVILGPKELGGGLGMDFFRDPVAQQYQDCVAACGSELCEGTMRMERDALGQDQYVPDVSIWHLYHGAQGYVRAPGGAGAYTNGLAATLQGFDGKYVRASASGRYGGIVHEAPFPGETGDVAEGVPYDLNAMRRGSPPPVKYIELGLKHTCGGDGPNGDIRAVATPEDALRVFASGHAIFTGIRWPSSWGQCDSNGFVTSRLGGGRGGHEILFCGYLRRKVSSASTNREELWFDLGNSWGANWGVNGHVLVPASQVVQAGVFQEAYSVTFANGWDKSIVLNWLKSFG